MTESSNLRIHIQPDTDATMEASNGPDIDNSSTETIKVANYTPNIDGGDHPSDEDDDNDETQEPLCPLFMDSLPKDFMSNPQLAAIASLLEDDEEDEKDKDDKRRLISQPDDNHRHAIAIAPRDGGGKIGRNSSRRNHRGATLSGPYPKQDKKTTEKRKTSLGEAQLFLNMWKI